MCMSVFPSCMNIHHIHAGTHRRQKEGVTSCGTKVINGCEPPFVIWESNLSCLRE